ncbi:MAG: translation initiation factor Sui1 [Phycisphaerales bacterium]|jgi:translation initiation factor 1
MAKDTGIVYSTEHGRMCPGCGKPIDQCACRKATAVPQGDGVVRVSRDVKGRRGKTMTVVTGVPLDESGLQKLATELKRKCGAGGTVKDGVIEIQGDHRDLVAAELTKRGYTVKLAGG